MAETAPTDGDGGVGPVGSVRADPERLRVDEVDASRDVVAHRGELQRPVNARVHVVPAATP